MFSTGFPDEFFLAMDKMKDVFNKYTLEVFKENGFPITKDQFTVLKVVSEKDESTQREIADLTLKDPAALTRIIDLLVNKGYAKREISKEDRRAFKIILTVDGSRLVNRMSPIIEEIKIRALNDISEEEQKSTKQIFVKMEDNLR